MRSLQDRKQGWAEAVDPQLSLFIRLVSLPISVTTSRRRSCCESKLWERNLLVFEIKSMAFKYVEKEEPYESIFR